MKRSFRVLLATVAVLAALCTGAWAATQVTDATTELKAAESPYYVEGTVTISNRFGVTGSVELELRDGCLLTAKQGIQVKSGDALTIEGGSLGTGKLIAEAKDGPAAIGGAGVGIVMEIKISKSA